MTPEEKRECPLLRCRKRFPNHELMLNHLIGCEQLAAGEYWCYECGIVERFNDAKCKRCLGHPSRRRKIVSMAKNFFSSLGHKSKNATLDLGDLDIDEAPPSYDSLVEPPQAPVEVFSNEIHEIDSCEIPLPTILEDMDEAETSDPLPQPTPALAPLPIQPLTIHPAELESAPMLDDSLFNWTPLPETVVPTNLFNRGMNKSPERPVLQVHTHDLQQYRAQQKRRSRVVPTSTADQTVERNSSVRSTASTSSTNSTNSTNSYSSTASYNISPISAWSGAWHRTPAFESTLTSPADDLYSPGGLFPTNPFANSCKAFKADDSGAFENGVSDSYLSELPADIPMNDALPTTDHFQDTLPTTDHFQDTLGLDHSVFSFDASLPAELSLESNLALTENSTMPPEMPQLGVDPTVGYYANPHSLVRTAKDTLEMHIASSMERLQQISKNHLVNQLRNMSPQSIALTGLEALTEILEGRRPTAPVKLLCFVHLVYSFSLVVYEQDVASRSTDLFGQAMSYSAWFSRHDSLAYRHIVNALWKPAAMSEADVHNLIRAKVSPAVSRTGSLKGKELAMDNIHQPNTDSLAFAAQHFLDALEYAAIQAVDQPEIQASQLCMQHIQDTSFDSHTDQPFALSVTFLLNLLSRQFSDSPGLAKGLKDLEHRVNANYVSTTRRLELELMHVGKMSLPPDVYFDSFIASARGQIDQLYKTIPSMNTRYTYYRHGVKLIETIIGGSDSQSIPTDAAPTLKTTALDSLDDFIGATSMDAFDFSTVSSFNPQPPMSHGPIPQPPLNFSGPMPDLTIDPCNLSNPQLTFTPEGSSSLGGPSTVATSPPSPAQDTSQNKVESNSCCELCGYRPKGDPRWFGGSMAKHKKLQHSTTPPKIYRCPFPGCTSQYKNRPDNLRQHQIEKGHFVDGQGEAGRRPNKRKKTDE
ncbi:Fc.00g087950.m01.CDS01 [Cosmosporella sp. VM-42]